jgi:hypothetical protein
MKKKKTKQAKSSAQYDVALSAYELEEVHELCISGIAQ